MVNFVAPPRHYDDTTEICDRLNRRILDLALALGLEPDRSSTAADKRFGRNGHLSIAPAKGLWRDHRDDDGGDGLELIRYALGYAKKDRAGRRAAFAWARDWLGLDGSAARPAPPPADRSTIEAEVHRARNRYRAQLIFDQAFSCLMSTPCERYLRRRGIWSAAQQTPLRWTKLDHPETHERDLDVLIVPLCAPGTRKVVGIQRIFLNPDGTKYDRGKAKLSLGDGGVALLHPPGQRLVLAEGVESALSASILYARPAWAFCGGFPSELPLPDPVCDVVIAADHDLPFDRNGRPKKTSLAKATSLARFLLASGRACAIEMPDGPGLDANDVLLARRAA